MDFANTKKTGLKQKWEDPRKPVDATQREANQNEAASLPRPRATSRDGPANKKKKPTGVSKGSSLPSKSQKKIYMSEGNNARRTNGGNSNAGVKSVWDGADKAESAKSDQYEISRSQISHRLQCATLEALNPVRGAVSAPPCSAQPQAVSNPLHTPHTDCLSDGPELASNKDDRPPRQLVPVQAQSQQHITSAPWEKKKLGTQDPTTGEVLNSKLEEKPTSPGDDAPALASTASQLLPEPLATDLASPSSGTATNVLVSSEECVPLPAQLSKEEKEASTREDVWPEAEAKEQDDAEAQFKLQERNALSDFREQSQKLKTKWSNLDSHEDLGKLDGVTTTDGRVTALYLDDEDIKGSLKPLGNLTKLTELRLQNNSLEGSLQPLENLINLTFIRLEDNSLKGSLQPLENLTQLTYLSLWNNSLEGSLRPLENLTQLTRLSLSNNSLEGDLEPLRDLKALKTLWLQNNQLTGDLEPLRDLRALEKLYVYNNQLTGSLFPLFGLTKLKMLYLAGNQFDQSEKGEIPDWMLQIDNDFEEVFTPGGIQPIDVQSMLNRALTVFAAVMAYVDIGTDLYAAARFYDDGEDWWCTLALISILISGFMASALSPRRLFNQDGVVDINELFLRTLSIFQLRLLYDLLLTLNQEYESPGFITTKYAEAIFEAVPQLWLQTYAALMNYDEVNGISPHLLLSIVCSSISLGWTITCLLDRHIIKKHNGGDQIRGQRSWVQKYFDEVPLLCLCTGYHLGEIAVQVCLLGLASYLLRWRSFLILLPYLFLTRFLIYWIGQGSKLKLQKPTASKIKRNLVTITSKVMGGIYFETVWQKKSSFIVGFVWSTFESALMIFGTLSGAFVPIDGQSSAPISNILNFIYAGLVIKLLCFVPIYRLHYSGDKVQPGS